MSTAPGFAYSEAPLKTVQEIQFGLFSPEETKNMSVCHIEYPETMDEQRQKPRERGLNDPKLGSIDRAFKCATCGENMTECPGHFGHIELAVPVFHPGTFCVTRGRLQNHLLICTQSRLRHQSQEDPRISVPQLRETLR